MPSTLNQNGLTIYRPGVYATIDASALGGAGLSTGNVAIVGDFRQFEENTPLTFTTASAVKDFDPIDKKLLTAAKMAFAPSTDDAVPGGAGTLTFVNVTPVTKASGDATDDAAANSVKFESKLAGKRGNRVKYEIATSSAGAETVDITLTREGLTEEYKNVGSPLLAEIYYSGSDAAENTLTLNTSSLVWNWQVDQTFTAPGGAQTQALTVSDLAADGQIYVNYITGGSGNVASDITVTVVGVNEAGDAKTGVATISAGAPGGAVFVQADAATVTWASITSITSATADAAFNGTVEVSGVAFSLTLSEWNSWGDVLSHIDGHTGYVADAKSPTVGGVPATEIDGASGVNVHGAGNKLEVYAHTYAVVQALAGSTLATVTRSSGGTQPPAQFGENPVTTQSAYLTGGTENPGSASYADALEAIEQSDIQIVALESDSVADHKALVTHCKNAAAKGFERNGYVAAPSETTLANLLANFTGQINSRHVALVAQKPTIVDSAGKSEAKDEWYLAVILAGMQAGSDIATPLTRKRPAVSKTSESWVPNRDAATAIKNGVIQLSSDNIGLFVERSVTTYLTDDNPIYSEVSANESVNSSVRDLRSLLNSKIGTAVTGATAKQLTGLVEDRLTQQVRALIIKGFRNVVLEDLGDTIRINYEVAATEPLNFISITANVQRF